MADPTLRGHYEANENVGVDGVLVETLGDINGSRNLQQTSGIAKGTLKENVIQDWDGIEFGATQFLEGLNNTDNELGGGDGSHYIVILATSGSTFRMLMVKATGIAGFEAGPTMYRRPDSTAYQQFADGTNRHAYHGGATLTGGVLTTIGCTWDDTGKLSQLVVDGIDESDNLISGPGAVGDITSAAPLRLGFSSLSMGAIFLEAKVFAAKKSVPEFAALNAASVAKYNNPMPTGPTEEVVRRNMILLGSRLT